MNTQELEAEIQQRYPALLRYLLPGVDLIVLKQKFSSINLYPSDEIFRFYSWTRWVDFDLMYKDGINLAYDLFNGFYPSYLDIENVSESILTIDGVKYWQFMQSDFGDFFITPMHERSIANELIYYMPEGLDPNYPDPNRGLISAFASLDQLIDTVITLLRSGAIYYTTENGVDALENSEELDVIGRQLNPDMDYWHKVQ